MFRLAEKAQGSYPVEVCGIIHSSFAVFFSHFFSGAGALAAYAKSAYALSQAEAAFRFRMETLGRIGIILASTISTIWLFAMVLSVS